jgi:hypothetical protein
MKLQELTDRRSTDQNKLMWALLTDLAHQVKWPVDGMERLISPDDWKHIMTAGLKKEQRIAAGIDGGFVILGQYTHKMNKAEMAELIELIQAFGTQRDVVWSEE